MKTICIGENLVDIYKSKEGTLVQVGGAPLNVACYLSQLGNDSYMISRISEDGYGKKILNVIEKYGVKKDYLQIDKENQSTRAIVEIDSTGDRKFTFERNNTAEFQLDEKEINVEYFKDAKVFHYCSVGLVDSPSKIAHIKALNLAKESGMLISFDVNLRLNLYGSNEECKNTVLSFLEYADIAKMTDEEIKFLFSIDKLSDCANKVFEEYSNIKLLFITMGEKGSCVFDRDGNSIFNEAKIINCVDTTGAGDCFSACCIDYIGNNGFSKVATDYVKCLEFATEECAKVCMKKGAL